LLHNSSRYLTHLFFPSLRPHLHLHSFPTRRSSDLCHRRAHRHPRPGPPSRRGGSPYPGVARRSHFPGRPRHRGGGSRTVALLLGDRKSTRLNSSHVASSYAVFCLKKKKNDDGDPVR